MAYTVEEKAKAIAIVQSHGGITQTALDDIWEAIGKSPSRSTLHDWVTHFKADSDSEKTESNRIIKKMPTAQDVQEAKQSLSEMFENVARQYLDRATDKDILDGLKGTQAITGAAISLDKLLKLEALENIPIEVLKALPEFIMTAESLGKNPVALINGMVDLLRSRSINDASSLH